MDGPRHVMRLFDLVLGIKHETYKEVLFTR